MTGKKNPLKTPKKIDYENPPLHVLLAIDMDVTDEIYWSKAWFNLLYYVINKVVKLLEI